MPPRSRPTLVAFGELLWDLLPQGARLGGAPANVAFQAAHLGAETLLVSSLGADRPGQRARAFWRRHGLSDRFIQTVERPTGTVAVELLHGQPRYRIARDVAWDAIAWRAELTALARRTDAVCFGSLAQRSPTTRATLRRFLRALPKSALRVFDVNLRRPLPEPEVLDASLRAATWLKLNREELRPLARRLGLTSPAGERGRAALAQELLRRYSLEAVIITAGEQGAEWVRPSVSWGAPAPSIRVVDTVGAGDAFTAALVMSWLDSQASGLSAGERLQQALVAGNALGAFVATRRGAMVKPPARWRRPLFQ